MNQLKLVENKSLTEAKVGFGFDPPPYTAKSPTKRNRIKLDSFSLEHLFLATSLWVEDDASWPTVNWEERVHSELHVSLFTRNEIGNICQNIGSPFAQVHDIV